MTLRCSMLALVTGGAFGAAVAEIKAPTPAFLGRLELSLSGEARGQILVVTDRFANRPGDRVGFGGGVYLEGEASYVLRNGAELRLRLRGEREEDAIGNVRLGAPDLDPSRGDRDQRTFLEVGVFEISGGYGLLSIGRVDGAADRAHVGGPNASRTLSISDDERDLAGLFALHAQNDLSGFSAKIRYETPRVLGVRVGASYAPQARRCDYGLCDARIVDDLEHLIELGFDFRRAFGSYRIRGGGGFTQAFSAGGAVSLRDVRVYAAGLAIGRADVDIPWLGAADLLIGGSYLRADGGDAAGGTVDDATTVDTPALETAGAYRIGEISVALRKDDVTLSFGAARSRSAQDDGLTQALQAAIEWRVFKRLSVGLGAQYGSARRADAFADSVRDAVAGVGVETRFRF